MKKLCSAALLCVLLLTLPGCSALLDRSYSAISLHSETHQAEEDSSILKVETYQELLGAVLYFVTQGADTGTIRFYNYTRDVNTDLESACLEVVQEDPLGAYAVDYVKYECKRVVSYYEATLHITYRRTPSQMSSILNVTGPSAIRTELSHALAQFQTEVVLRVSYFDSDPDSLLELCREAYWATPLAALGEPEVTVSLYPDTGTQRIIELSLLYPGDSETLTAKADSLLSAATQLQESYAGNGVNLTLQGIFSALSQSGSYTPGGEDTAYAALVEGSAGSGGIALAVELLCQLQDISCSVVSGTLNGESRVWNIVLTEDGYRHLDAASQSGFLLSDAQAFEYGYVWDLSSTERCGDPIPAQQAAEAEPDTEQDAQ